MPAPSAHIQDPTHQRELILRLKRVEGQLRAIQAMIEAGEDCEKIVQQLSAGRKALDKAFFNVLACAVASGEDRSGRLTAEKRLEQAAALLAKFG